MNRFRKIALIVLFVLGLGTVLFVALVASVYQATITQAVLAEQANTAGGDGIASNAIMLAWEKGTPKSTYSYGGGKPTELFSEALQEVYPNRNSWSDAPRKGASCDVFVGTVIRYSGYDDQMPRGLGDMKSGQWEHLASSPLWEEIPYDYKEDVLLNGDVIIYQRYSGSEHICIYVVIDGEGYLAEAAIRSTYGHLSKVESNSKIFKSSDKRKCKVYRACGEKSMLDYIADFSDIKAGVANGKREAYPSKNNPYFFSSRYNAFVGTLYGPPAIDRNCTWYAYGRFAEIIGRKPNGLPTGNAEDWYDRCTAFRKGRTPKVGSIIVWRFTDRAFGHVAIVEQVFSNGDILTSNSGYGSNVNFWVQKWTKKSGYQGGHQKLIGFIYPP